MSIKRVCSLRNRRLTGSELAASVNVTSGLSVSREEATPGCWPSRQSSKEIAKSETDNNRKKDSDGTETQTLDRRRRDADGQI